MIKPRLIAHTDWSSKPEKRWMVLANFDGSAYSVNQPKVVETVDTLVQSLIEKADGGRVILGFDFPIGLPLSYAKKANIESFPESLPRFGKDKWARFYDIAGSASEISLNRPFYPFRPGGTKQAHLLEGLGMATMTDLLRECERPYPQRGPACPLFWTLGAKQVGRAAISGWQDVLSPALRAKGFRVSLWPFDGDLAALLKQYSCIIVETYPAEACLHLDITPPGRGWSKRKQEDRAKHYKTLSSWAEKRKIKLSSSLDDELRDGFGPSEDGEDPFDATLGIFSMLEVVLGHRSDGAPQDPARRRIEGWIFGQAPRKLVAM
jgi:hypothetical protein